MESRDFDRLARLVGSGQSRRRVLKSLAGGALAALGFGTAAAAHQLRSVGNSCNTNSDCASGLCVQEARTRKICHCAAAGDCPNPDLCHPTVCSAGACVAGAPVVCPTPDQCHTQGVCNPSTGVCSNPAKTNGTACDDGNASTCNDVCTNGTCGGSACLIGDICTDNGCTCQAGDTLSPVKAATPPRHAPSLVVHRTVRATPTPMGTPAAGITAWGATVRRAAPAPPIARPTAPMPSVCQRSRAVGNICVRACGGGGIEGGASVASASITSASASNPLGPS